jgi:hypothetical protein
MCTSAVVACDMQRTHDKTCCKHVAQLCVSLVQSTVLCHAACYASLVRSYLLTCMTISSGNAEK